MPALPPIVTERPLPAPARRLGAQRRTTRPVRPATTAKVRKTGATEPLVMISPMTQGR